MQVNFNTSPGLIINRLIIINQATIFIPQLVSIAQVDITPQFIGAHIYVTNPANTNEFVTFNGCIGVFAMRNELKVLNIIDTVRPFTAADLTGIFSRRYTDYIHFINLN